MSFNYDGSLPTTTTWAGTVVGSVSRTYDNNFRVTSRSINGAHSIGFAYDNDSLLTSAGALTLSRNAQNGLLTGTTLGSVTDSWSYNTFSEAASYTASFSGMPVYSANYSYDKLGRITSKTETIQGATDTLTYGYDPAGRLQAVSRDGQLISSYTYDSNSNRQTRTTSTGMTSYNYDAQDRLTAWNLTAETWGLTYSANGELQSKSNGGETTTYQYDVVGNLRHVGLPGGTNIDYVIDGQNRRVGRRVNGALVQGWLYGNQPNPLAELDGNSNVVSIFVYGSRANVPDYLVKNGITYRIIADHLGSPRLIIDSSTGNVIQRLDYDEFGSILQDTNPGFQPFGFAGGLYDPQTKLIRFGARDYDAETGRWTAKDPILFDGGDPNLYGYVLNDPVNRVDPLGLVYFIPRSGPDDLPSWLPNWIRDIAVAFYNDPLALTAGLGSTAVSIASKAVVIGEGMEAVREAASASNATWYRAWGKFCRPENFTLEQSLRRQARWMSSKIEQGYRIYDIGIDPTRAQRSPFYELERNILDKAGYPTTPMPRP
jgi:RHS repeat-associated protein